MNNAPRVPYISVTEIESVMNTIADEGLPIPENVGMTIYRKRQMVEAIVQRLFDLEIVGERDETIGYGDDEEL